jgi:hypothetical protein
MSLIERASEAERPSPYEARSAESDEAAVGQRVLLL